MLQLHRLLLSLTLLTLTFIYSCSNTLDDHGCIDATTYQHPEDPKYYMNEARYGFTYEAVDDQIFALGGFTGTPTSDIEYLQFHTTYETYSVQDEVWNNEGLLPETQQGGTSEYYDNKIFIFGGYFCDKDFQILDLETNEIEVQEEMPVGIYSGTSERVGDEILLFGLCEEDGNTRNLNILSYNILDHSWQYKDPIPTNILSERISHSAIHSIKHDGIIYLWVSRELLTYDPQSGNWDKIALAGSKLLPYQQAVSFDDAILFCGGSVNNSKAAATNCNIFAYFPETNTWKTYHNMTNFKRQFGYGFVNIDHTLYIFGGREYESWEPLNQVEIIEDFEL